MKNTTSKNKIKILKKQNKTEICNMERSNKKKIIKIKVTCPKHNSLKS